MESLFSLSLPFHLPPIDSIRIPLFMLLLLLLLRGIETVIKNSINHFLPLSSSLPLSSISRGSSVTLSK